MKPFKKPNSYKRNVSRVNQIMVVTGIDDLAEIERLLEKADRKRKFEKKKKAKELNRPKQPKKQLRDQPFMKKEEVSIDSNLVLSFIQLLVDKKMITQEELQTLTLNENNPLKQVDFKLENKVLSKSQLKGYWLYLMSRNSLYCALCGHPITEESNKGPWKLTAEHRIPRSKGGATDSTNLDPSHSVCNMAKDNLMPEEWAKVGLERLRSYGIHVDTTHALYNYLIHSKEK